MPRSLVAVGTALVLVAVPLGVLAIAISQRGPATRHLTAEEARIRARAVDYAETRLHARPDFVLRSTYGTGAGDCAMVEVRTPAGDRRVLLAATGPYGPQLWQPFAVSRSFAWNQYVPDSDGMCGLHAAGLASNHPRLATGYATS